MVDPHRVAARKRQSRGRSHIDRPDTIAVGVAHRDSEDVAPIVPHVNLVGESVSAGLVEPHVGTRASGDRAFGVNAARRSIAGRFHESTPSSTEQVIETTF